MKILGIILLIIAFIYLLSPIDLIPDIIPIIGWIDDAIFLIASIIILVKP